jgi:hypothetical protein
MSYETFRVEITRDETRASGGVSIEITAYIDRVPETNDYSFGMLTRVPRGVWNSRLQFAGDFAALSEALAAIAAAHPGVDRVRCYEYTVDDEYPREVAPLVKSSDKWRPGDDVSDSKPPS